MVVEGIGSNGKRLQWLYPMFCVAFLIFFSWINLFENRRSRYCSSNMGFWHLQHLNGLLQRREPARHCTWNTT